MTKRAKSKGKSSSKLYKAVNKALNEWHRPNAASNVVLDGLLSIQQAKNELHAGENPARLREAINQVLGEALEDMAAKDTDEIEVLKLRFLEEKKIADVAKLMGYSESQVSRLQQSATEQLVQILLGKDRAMKRARAGYLESLLPAATYSQLFGVDNLCRTLSAQLTEQEPPWVVALVGMGGLGKTAVAHSVTLGLIHQLAVSHLAWVKAEPPHTMSGLSGDASVTYEKIIGELLRQLFPEEPLPATLTDRKIKLRQTLRHYPHLIVVDNLESEKDTAFLAQHLTDLANPSKFLLTTRSQIVDQVAVREVRLDTLGRDDSLALMRHRGRERGIREVAEATDADLDRLFAQVGGNPYALKMVVDLLDVMTLDHLLDGLLQNHPKQVIDIYTHIFRQAWRSLSDNGRNLLRAMPLIPDSSDVDYLLSISGLTEAEIWPAIEELRLRSLLEVEGGIREKKYGIHRLTDTFLRTEIIHFPL